MNLIIRHNIDIIHTFPSSELVAAKVGRIGDQRASTFQLELGSNSLKTSPVVTSQHKDLPSFPELKRRLLSKGHQDKESTPREWP
jgi:hypothetical protein